MKETRFKQTDIGLVPEDWEITTLGKSCEMPTDTIAANLFDRHLYISTDNLLQNCQGAVPFEGKLAYKKVREYRAGDSLVSNIRPNLHKTFYAKQTGGCSTDVIVLRPKEGLDSRILYAIICDKRFAATVAAEAVGTKMPRGDKNTIRSYTFSIPKDLSEQKCIAEMLSRVDELLVRLDKLIVKKQAVKQGTMQQLLTGRTKLKGFNEPWEEKSFSNVLRSVPAKKYTFEQSEYLERGKYTIIDQGTSGKTAYTNDKERIYPNPNCSAIIFGDHTRDFKYRETPFALGADGTKLLIVEENVNAKFLFYYCQCLSIPNTGYNRHFKYLQESVFLIPSSLVEQRAIARILTHMDKEIEALQTERRKVEQIKKGMMQQLLTGKIRLSV